MTELSKHIEILLLDNDCVIVPGFGGFMAHQVCSVYSEDENLFLPPSRTLGFNPQLKINDSLLVQSYVEAYDLSYPEALRKIQGEVQEIKLTLTNTGSYELPDIGVITTNGDGHYDFEPCLAGILTPGLYALSSFEMEMLSDVRTHTPSVEEVPSVHLAEAKKKQHVLPVAESLEEPDEAEDNADEEVEEESPKIISINVNTLKRVVATAAVVIFLILFSLPLGEQSPDGKRLCTIDSSMLQKMMPHMEQSGSTPSLSSAKPAEKSPAKEKSVTPVETKTETKAPTQAVTPAKAPTTQASAEVKGNYVIVLACMGKKDNIKGAADNFRKRGVADARPLVCQGCPKIITGSYKDVKSAVAAFHDLQAQNPSVKAGWYLRIK